MPAAESELLRLVKLEPLSLAKFERLLGAAPDYQRPTCSGQAESDRVQLQRRLQLQLYLFRSEYVSSIPISAAKPIREKGRGNHESFVQEKKKNCIERL